MAKAWELTWNQILEIGAARRTPVTDFCGRLICSQDRPLDPRQGRTAYLETLRLARQAGKPVPEHVKASEPGVFPSQGSKQPENSGPYAGMKPMKLPEEPPAPEVRSAPLSLFD